MDTLELVSIEDLLEDECKCEASYHLQGCSGRVTHRFRAKCAPSGKNVCAATAYSVTTARTHICANCLERVGDCWTITPI